VKHIDPKTGLETAPVSGKVFAPLSNSIAQANNACAPLLGRDCAVNFSTNAGMGKELPYFVLSSEVMATIQASPSAVQAIRSVIPVTPTSERIVERTKATGPQANITE
jgi:hypothetical protein